MPAVFVHGVPDTERLWDPLRHELDRRDAVTLTLPGFGTDTPPDWCATKEEYAAWLRTELEHIGEPVDLVAHDWGAILAQRVASTHPNLVRTLAVGSGPLDRDYEWHAMAQLWQTPDAGEQLMEALSSTSLEDRAAGFMAGGSPTELARIQAGQLDDRMARCILALYRSAVTVGAEWQGAVEAMPHRPAVVFHGADDPYVDVGVAQRLATRLDAELVIYAECNHWWPWAHATETAQALTELWR